MRLARLGQACIGRGGSTAEAVAGRERGAEKVECKRGFALAKGNGHSYTVVTPCLVCGIPDGMWSRPPDDDAKYQAAVFAADGTLDMKHFGRDPGA
jgi:hypothetical protein